MDRVGVVSTLVVLSLPAKGSPLRRREVSGRHLSDAPASARQWKNLTQAEKASYEERAARMNADTMASMRTEMAAGGETPSRPVNGVSLVGPDVVYDCCWQNCDAQFEEMNDLIEHNNQEGTGHVHQYASTVSSGGECALGSLDGLGRRHGHRL